MKIYAFVDTHGDMKGIEKIRKKSEKADLLICAGDITVFEENIERVLKKLDSIGKKILIIHGNHETEETMKTACKLCKNLVFLHKKTYKQDDFLFIGYGNLGFSLEDSAVDRFAKKFRKKVKEKTVIITHAPPYNTKLDKIWNSNHGNRSIRKFIEKLEPVVAISGHLHENNGKEDKIKNTKVINPGPYGKLIKL
ncbi:MAG: hypothetical protein GY861_09005 [bacterium]|nr:hypothetical protein [bacterium]